MYTGLRLVTLKSAQCRYQRASRPACKRSTQANLKPNPLDHFQNLINSSLLLCRLIPQISWNVSSYYGHENGMETSPSSSSSSLL